MKTTILISAMAVAMLVSGTANAKRMCLAVTGEDISDNMVIDFGPEKLLSNAEPPLTPYKQFARPIVGKILARVKVGESGEQISTVMPLSGSGVFKKPRNTSGNHIALMSLQTVNSPTGSTGGFNLLDTSRAFACHTDTVADHNKDPYPETWECTMTVTSWAQPGTGVQGLNGYVKYVKLHKVPFSDTSANCSGKW